MSFRPKDAEEEAVGFSLRTAFGKGSAPSAPLEATPNSAGSNAFGVFNSLSATNAHSARSAPSGLPNSRSALHVASAPRLTFNFRSDSAPKTGHAGQAASAGLPSLINAFEPKARLGQTGQGVATLVGGSKQEAIRLMAQVDNLRERLSEAQSHSQTLQLQQNAIANAFHEAKTEFHSRLATMRDELVIAQRAEDCMRREADEHKRKASAARLEASAARSVQLSESAQLSNDLNQKIDALTRERDALSRQVIEAGSKLAHAETAASTAQAACAAAIEAAKAESTQQLAEAKAAAASVAAVDMDQAAVAAVAEASAKDLRLARERIGELSINESKLEKDVSKLEAQLQAAIGANANANANACAVVDAAAVGKEDLDELKKLQADVHEADVLNKELDLKLVRVRAERDEALKRVEVAEAFVETVATKAAVDKEVKAVAEDEGLRVAHVPWDGGVHVHQEAVGALPLHLQQSPILQAGDKLFNGFSVGVSPRASAEEHPMSMVHSPSAFLHEIAAAAEVSEPAAVGGAPTGAEQMVNAILGDLKAFMNESVAPKSASSLIATVG